MRQSLCIALALGVLALAAPLAGAQAAKAKATASTAQAADKVTLAADAQLLDVHYDGKATTAAKVEVKMSPFVRQALNDWAKLAARSKLEVVVPQHADALVMGRASVDQMLQTTKVMDQTAALFDGLKPAQDAHPGRAIVVVLFDEEGFKSEAWPAFIDELVARNDIQQDFADRMKGSPGSFTLRNASMFIQHTYDIAGNKAAGDDEYRFANEVAHKTAQYLLEARFGRQPDVLRWGLGYVAEQRLYGNAYQFNASGFVNKTDHFGWPSKTRDLLVDHAKSPNFTLADAILKTRDAGTPEFGQELAWGTLEYELAKEPAHLAELLGQLGALDRAGDPQGLSLEWRGDAHKVHDLCDAAWSKLKVATLASYLKGLKSVAGAPPADDDSDD